MQEFAGINKMDAVLAKIVNEAIKLHAETAKLNAETAKLHTEGAKLFEETLKIQREAKWHPVFWTVAALGAAAAFGKLFL